MGTWQSRVMRSSVTVEDTNDETYKYLLHNF